MRLLRFLFFYVPLIGGGAILALFLIQNWRPVRLDLFGPQYSISLTWVLVAAMVVGAFVAAILLLPGRLAASLRTWGLERELRRCEQDLWRLQERRERLLIQHERLLEAHERMLLAHQDLVEEHSLVLTERDEARAQVDAARALPAHQPEREPIPLARIAGASATSAAAFDSPASLPAIAAAGGPRPNGGRGGGGSAPLPRWAAPPPAARPAAGALSEAARDEVAREAGEQPVALVRVEAVPAPSHAVAEPPSPRSAPILLAEPIAVSSVLPIPPVAVPMAPSLSSPSAPHHAMVRSSASQLSLITMLRSRMRADIVESTAALAALRTALEARLARLKRTLYRGKVPIAPSGSTPGDLPTGDDRG
jgi:uncharacterized integral membrane protein